MSGAYSHIFSKLVQGAVLQSAILDSIQSQCYQSRYSIHDPIPWSEFRSATKTWAEARLLCLRCILEECAVLSKGSSRWTNRSTVDSCSFHRDEEDPVESRIM